MSIGGGAGIGLVAVTWIGVTAVSGFATAGIFVSDIIGQTSVLTGDAGIPVMTLLATALSGLAGIIVQGIRLFYRGDIVSKSLIVAVVKEALEAESTRRELEKKMGGRDK